MLLYFLSSKDMIFLILHKKSVRSIIHAHILIHSKVKEKMQIHSITYKDIHEKYNTDRLFAQIIGRISALTILQYIN